MILIYIEGWETLLQAISEKKEINPLGLIRKIVAKDAFLSDSAACPFTSNICYLTQLHILY